MSCARRVRSTASVGARPAAVRHLHVGCSPAINECGLLSVVYADDTQIYIQVEQRDISVAKVRVENCIANIKQWLASNRLRQNASKTKIM